MGHPGAGKTLIVGLWRDGAAGVLCGDGLCAEGNVDFANLDKVSSTHDSHFRVKLLTTAQSHFVAILSGIDFRPEMLTASYNNVTGQLVYTVNGVRSAGRYVGKVDRQGNPVLVTYSDGTVEQAVEYQSDVKTMISLLQPVKRKVAEKTPLTSQTSQGTQKYCEVKRRLKKALQFGNVPRCRTGTTGGILKLSESVRIISENAENCNDIGRLAA